MRANFFALKEDLGRIVGGNMLSRSHGSPLTFEDAMSIHVYRSLRCPYRELLKRFGNHPEALAGILTGRLYAKSRAAALDKFTHGEYWHPEITRLIAEKGYMRILSALSGAGAKAGKPNVPFSFISIFKNCAAWQ